METVLVALVGGGLAGAIVSGAMTLLAQRRAFEHERKTRFLDLKRERYAALLRDSDAWVRAQWRQLDMVEGKLGAWSRNDLPPLPPTLSLELLADEIELLAPYGVGTAASLLADA